MDVLTSQQLIAAIDEIVCSCGYKPDDQSRCFTMEEKDGSIYKIVFECPVCGSSWEGTRAAIN